MDKIIIEKVETYNRLDSIYIEVHCKLGEKKWIENFAGEEWLQKDESGNEKFVSRVIENYKKEPKLTTVDKLKEKYKNKEIQVV